MIDFSQTWDYWLFTFDLIKIYEINIFILIEGKWFCKIVLTKIIDKGCRAKPTKFVSLQIKLDKRYIRHKLQCDFVYVLLLYWCIIETNIKTGQNEMLSAH